MKLTELVKKYINNGYKINDAEAKVCQNIILIKISKSPFYNNVTIKGGVVMHSISNDKRCATKDLDIDFIKYSLSDKSIKEFVAKLNLLNDGITIKIFKDIAELKQQDYHGKRVYINLIDNFGDINKEKLMRYFEIMIFNDLNMDKNNIKDVYNTLERILRKKRYLENFDTIKNNWLELPIVEVVDSVLRFIQKIKLITV